MPTEKPRFTITLEEELVKKINDYKFSHRMKNQTQAVVSLIEKGFESLLHTSLESKKSPAPEGAEDQISMEESNRLFDALVQAGLIDDSMNFSEADIAFFDGVSRLINAWVMSHRR